MRMREAVIAGLPLYSPRLCSPSLCSPAPSRLLSGCFHSGREDSVHEDSALEGSRREEPACLDAHDEKLNEMRRNTQTSTFRLVHKYLHHLA